jgi:FkbM family methyltransferase
MKKLLSEIRYKIRRYWILYIRGRSEFKVKVKCNALWYGNDYGGFYVAIDKINSDSIVYSIGIGEDISFDKELNSSFGCKIFMFDPTPKSIQWIEQQELSDSYHFLPIGISDRTGELEFLLPKNDKFVSGSIIPQINVTESKKIIVKVDTLLSLMKYHAHSAIDILKIDIEGYEYDVIPQILSSAISIQQILVEFHSRFFSDGEERTSHIIKLLEDYGYSLFAISDSLEEASFIKN